VSEDVSEEIKEEEEVKKEEVVDETTVAPMEGLLLSQDSLLSTGIHIGTKIKTRDMEPFIYRVRGDGLFVLDLKKTDERIRTTAKFLARFEPTKIAVAAARLYAHEPVMKFCEIVGATPITGRFVPGMLLNPIYPRRIEPDVILVSDPRADFQAVKEASSMGIPIIALCSTDNDFGYVDLVIPTNNKGRRALAVIYWLLARQVMRERGEIAPDGEMAVSLEDFEVKLVEKSQQTQ
jgi:small subunit ribosomal protein S2